MKYKPFARQRFGTGHIFHLRGGKEVLGNVPVDQVLIRTGGTGEPLAAGLGRPSRTVASP